MSGPNDRRLFWRAARELLPHKGRLAISFASVAVRGCLLMLPPFLTQRLIDQGLQQQNRAALWLYGTAAVGATLLAITLILADVWAASYVQHVTAGLRTRLYQRLQTRPLSFFLTSQTGDLLSRLLQDSQAFSDLFFNDYGGGLIGTAGWAITTGLIGLIAMFRLDAPLSLGMLLLYAAEVAAMRLFGPLSRRAGKETAEARAAVTETLRETVTGISYVKAAGLEGSMQRRFEAQLQRFEALQLHTILLARALRIAQALPEIFSIGLIYLLGSRHVMTGQLTVGGLIAFGLFATWVQGPVSVLTEQYVQQVRRLMPAVERTFALLDESPEPEPGFCPETCQGAIVFEHVTFGYAPETPVLKEFSLSIAAGEVVAMVGPSGAGKSTLADLLTGHWHPQAGAVRLDGHDLRDLDPSWLRRNVCAVAQDAVVLNESIAFNVGYGRPTAPNDDLLAAAADSALDSFLERLPAGLQTRVGERGAQLSGGQKQRIGIARALLYDPQVLILDESTSALDQSTEATVMTGIRRRFAGRTVIVIAHRLSAVRDADRIVVVADGQVVESGTHASLLRNGGLYCSLYANRVGAALSSDAPSSNRTCAIYASGFRRS